MSQPTKTAVFKTARMVIKADNACRQSGLAVKVKPVPPSVSSDCGMCLEITAAEVEQFKALMASLNIEMKIYDNNLI